MKPPYLRLIGSMRDGTKIFGVDGNKVRDMGGPLADFVEGGHDLVYDQIPKGEIWLEEPIPNIEDEDKTAAHEMFERTIMTKGMKYDEAHQHALAMEQILRKIDKDFSENTQGESPAKRGAPGMLLHVIKIGAK